MITDIEDFFTKGCGRCSRFATPDCSTRQWHQGLLDLRRICRAAGLAETVKWGHPCYEHAGRNIALFGALRGDFRLSFFNAALLADPEGILEKPGPNTQIASMIRFTQNGQVRAMEAVIQAYLREAMQHAEAGTRPPPSDREIELPYELIDAFEADLELSEAFRDLTPGRQRSYVIALASAKTSATRAARVEKFRSRIIAGKGAMER